MWFCSNPSRGQKDWALLTEKQQYGHPLHTFGVKNFWRTIRNNKENIEKIAHLFDNRGFQASGLSVAFSRFTQAVSISAMRGSATMLIARDSRL